MRERQDDELGALLGRALDSGLDAPVDTAGLVAGAHRGARRIRRRRRVGVAAVAVLAVAGVPIGQDLLFPAEQPVEVAATPVQEASPPPASLSLPPASDATAGALAQPATPSATPSPTPLARVDGRLVVPTEAMLDLDAARALVAEADAGTLGTWTADSGVDGTGWPQRVPCSDGPDEGEVAQTQGLRELGSDDGDGATLYTSVVVYQPGEVDAAWERIAASIADGTCEGGLITQTVPTEQEDVLVGTSGDGTIAIALRRVGEVVVSTRLYTATGADTAGLAGALLDLATERLHASGFAASVEADEGG